MPGVTRLSLLLPWLALACGGSAPERSTAPTPAPAASAPAPRAAIEIDVEPPDAEVIIDGKELGPASALPSSLPLDPGLHRITIRKDGYQTWRAEMSLQEGTEPLQVRLEPKR